MRADSSVSLYAPPTCDNLALSVNRRTGQDRTMDTHEPTNRRDSGQPRFIPAATYLARHRARQTGAQAVWAWLRFGHGWMLALGALALALAAILTLVTR